MLPLALLRLWVPRWSLWADVPGGHVLPPVRPARGLRRTRLVVAHRARRLAPVVHPPAAAARRQLDLGGLGFGFGLGFGLELGFGFGLVLGSGLAVQHLRPLHVELEGSGAEAEACSEVVQRRLRSTCPVQRGRSVG